MSQKNRKLGRTSDQRRAMLRAMVTYLLENGQIKTTITRLRKWLPCREDDHPGQEERPGLLPSGSGFITKEDVAKKLFQELGPSMPAATAATPAS